ncbi:hypothetical protein [Vibrio cionasavignyae]|uniref:hypothetical protein n=1 Tax=Vibrio cionasavignyae TaxID=2910252 RepID=UPI003D0A06A4
MKVSNLKKVLDSLPDDKECHVVTGEKWLPERLIHTELDNDLLFLEFDNAPDEGEEGIEGRGFVDHEIDLLRSRITDILGQNDSPTATADALLGFFLVGHELSSSDFVELLESMEEEIQSTPFEGSNATELSSSEVCA